MPDEQTLEGIDPEVFEGKGEQAYAENLLKDDPEYQEALKNEKKSGKKSDGEGSDSDEGNQGGSGDGSGGDGNDGGTGDDEVDTDTDGDDSGKGNEANNDETAYEDDIIPGLKGAQFGALSEDLKEIISGVHDHIESSTKKLADTEARLNKLLEDPIIKHREEIINSGTGKDQYELPAMTDQEISEIINHLDQGTADSNKKARDVLEKIGKRMAEVVESNVLLNVQTKIQREKMAMDAGNKLIELSKMHPELSLEIDDPENPGKKISFADAKKLTSTQLDKIPGVIGKFINKLAEMQKNKIIASPGQYINAKSVESLYAEIAIENNLPLMKNADAKVKKMLNEHGKKIFDRFLKSKDGGRQMADGKELGKRPSTGSHVVDGIDVVKLAKDDDYHEKMLYKKGDIKWFDKIADLRERGERLLKENPDLSSSS